MIAFLDKPKEGFYKYEAVDFEKKLAPTLNVSIHSLESSEEEQLNAKKTPSMSPK